MHGQSYGCRRRMFFLRALDFAFVVFKMSGISLDRSYLPFQMQCDSQAASIFAQAANFFVMTETAISCADFFVGHVT